MFGKRRRAASNPSQRAPPPSASASLAATKAFIKDRESNGDLSSAAAAAALRTHATTPTPVGETVTKRMVRRGSTSSNGSNQKPPPGPLRRQSSSGSMTERSFRAASPGRGSPADPNAPPVPPVPQHVQQGSVVHRRASSLEPVYRGGSPGPRGGGRGVSLDRGASTAGRGQGQRPPTSQLAQVSEEEDAAARSVNFSRPMSPGQTTAKNPSPPTSSGWFGGPAVNQEAVQRMAATSRPQAASGVSAYGLQNAQRSVQNAAERPVKIHQVSRGVEGSRLSSGSMRAKPSGTAVQSRSFVQPATRQASGPVDPNSPNAIYDPSTRTFIHKQDAMARHRELHQEPEQPTRQYVAQHVDDYRPQHISQQHSGQRSPSPVRQYVQRDESPTPQRRGETLLPRSDNTARRTEPVQRHSAHFADADIHPEQANTGRKLGNTTQDTGVEHIEYSSSPQFVSNQDSSYPRLATPTIPAPTNTVAGQARAGHDRNASLSPMRNAHFAPVAIELTGSKHEPLPRSVSPAKSALKSSPSVSRRGNSPVASNERPRGKGQSSEVSDTASDDGSRTKRTTRVSFEETPVTTATAVYTEEELPTTPPGLSSSKWSSTTEKENEFEDFMKPRPALPLFGSIREKERRPTPEDMAEKVTETVSTTPMSASMGSIGETSHASSDHALGSIVGQDFAQRQRAANNPVPPEVTTVEGSGYVSDSSEESGTQKHGEAQERWELSPAPEPKSLTAPFDEKSTTTGSASGGIIDVPEIALLPATPSPYERPEPKYQSMMIPGGWGDEVPEAEKHKANIAQTAPKEVPSAPVVEPIHQQPLPSQQAEEEDDTSDDNSSVYSDAYEDLEDTEGGFASIDALMESPVAPSSSGLMSSKYADKSDTESPTSKIRNETAADDYADSGATATRDWTAAQQHWSGLNVSREQPQHDEPVVERPSHAGSVLSRVMQAPVVQEEIKPDYIPERKVAVEPVPRVATPPQVSQPATKPLKSALKKTPVPQAAPSTESHMRKSMRGPPPREAPPSETHMKKTMRSGPVTPSRPEPQMRSSMRGGPDTTSRAQPQMRKSMRADDAPPSTNMGLAASRHSMVPVESKPPRGALQKRNIPAAAAAASKARPQSMPAAKRVAAPAPTYDSDSDGSASSFQRTRGRQSRNQGGGRYTMRGSMRQEPAPTMRAAAPAPKQVRAISPPGSPAPALRKSMRPSSPTPEAVKSSKFSIRSLSPMGRFRTNKVPDARTSSPTQPKSMPAFTKQQKQPTPKAPVAERAKAPFRSRFAESSDEDEDDQPRRFQSRFADSDDDEPIDYKLPPGLAPVRGIPKKQGEEDGDSTDLEEETDVEGPTPAGTSAANGVTNGHTNGNATAEGAALSAGSLRDSKHASTLPSFEAGDKAKTKRGFFGLGKKKTTATEPGSTQPHSTQPEPTQPDATQPTTGPEDIPMPPSQRRRELGLPLTPIDEDKDFGTPENASPQSKKSPKLQRRSTPEWPLPPPPAIGKEDRPMSSDGIAPRRPRFAMRQSSQTSNVTSPVVDAQGRTVSYGRTGKKKKFQGLRRVFGLND